MKYICNECGKEHNEWPALTFKKPDPYTQLSDEEKATIAVTGSDDCIISYPDQTDRFIRVTLIQKVNDSCQDLHYGLWVSVSEKSYNDYSAHYNDTDYITTYFGRICNSIPRYKDTFALPVDVNTKPGNARPVIVPHQDTDNPFVHDYYNGITVEDAEIRVASLM